MIADQLLILIADRAVRARGAFGCVIAAASAGGSTLPKHLSLSGQSHRKKGHYRTKGARMCLYHPCHKVAADAPDRLLSEAAESRADNHLLRTFEKVKSDE
jgi:hypothetical protein